MAHGAVAISPPKWLGLIAGALALAAVLGPLAALLARTGGAATLGPADWAALRFTLVQAVLSAGVSVLLAVPVARALARRSFRGRGIFVTLLGAPFLLPVIVAVMGLLAVWGRSGIVNSGLGALGLPTLDIYGLDGVVLAHVFLNLPLAVRFLLQGWLAIPAERFRLAATLNLPVFRLIEAPMLARVVPGAFLVIFLLCLTSFAVALILGGGPRATTLELAIYQALRFQFDLDKAAVLAGLQLALGLAAMLLVARLDLPPEGRGGLDRVVQRFDRSGGLDALWLGLAGAFLLVPLGAVVLRGAVALPDLPAAVWPAALRSLAVALGATVVAVGLGFALALRGGRLAALGSVLPLALSALVLGTGWFVILHPVMNPTRAALPLTALVNGIAALPFVLRLLGPAVAREMAAQGRLAESLGLRGRALVRIVLLPRLRGPLAFSAGLSAALSMGDLGIIALFGGGGQATLPLLMAELMGSYRTDAAAAVGLVLVTLSLALFWIIDREGRRHA